MTEITVIDPICVNNDHFLFNLSVLNKTEFLKPVSRIRFWAYESNASILTNCKQLGYNVFPLKEYSSYFKRIFVSFFRIFWSKSPFKAEKIIFLAIDNTLIPLFFLINLFLIPFLFKKISIVSHNNLHSAKTNFFKRILLRSFLYCYQPRVILLSLSLADEFKKVTRYNKVFGFLHQNFLEFTSNCEVKKNISGHGDLIKIFVAHSHSGFFIEIINRNIELIREKTTNIAKNVLFEYISETNLEVVNINSIVFKRISRPRDMATYFGLVVDADYIFFPMEMIGNTRASGVLMDALTVGTSFIGPNVGHFKDLNSEYNFGFLYNDLNELFSLVADIANGKVSSEFNEDKFKTFFNETNPRNISRFLFA